MAEQFSGKIFSLLLGAMTAANVHIGVQLNLWKTLAEQKNPISSEDFARATQCNERYLREWLKAMAVEKIIDAEMKNGVYVYSLPKDHDVLANEDNPFFSPIALLGLIPSIGKVIPDLVEAFKTGERVDYEKYGHSCREAIAKDNRFMYLNQIKTFIHSMPSIEEQLNQGGKILDVGCGWGYSSIGLARSFPKVYVDGIDIDEESIKEAKAVLSKENSDITSRTAFYAKDVTQMNTEGQYTLITALECVHDMDDPVSVLSKMRTSLKSSGCALVMDFKAHETISETIQNGLNLYNVSTLLCLPAAGSKSAATGTNMTESLFRKYAKDAKFTKVDVLPIDHPLFRFYQLFP